VIGFIRIRGGNRNPPLVLMPPEAKEEICDVNDKITQYSETSIFNTLVDKVRYSFMDYATGLLAI
jgi:hypothetical protein